MPSYKTMWQEASQEIERLKAEVSRLTDALFSSPDASLRELERTRQIVDLAGIARHMRVERFTPQQWQQRGHLPPVDFPEIRTPLWYASTIREHFADRTQRIWYDRPDDEGLSPAA